jgi:hypothetical protein
MKDRLHILLGKLPYIRKYRQALELAFSIMTFEQRQEFRNKLPKKSPLVKR